MDYGVPYQGSKSKIAEQIVRQLPSATHFYDLFAGGCAITHCACLSGKYQNIHYNDINPNGITLFYNAIHKKYHNETRWISREDFFRLKDTDPYVALCWSFGSDQKSYLYGRDIEPYKKAGHYAVVFHDLTYAEELGIDATSVVAQSSYVGAYNAWRQVAKELGMNNLLQSLLNSNRLLHLERLERLEQSYESVKIEKNSIIYCDIPYKHTKKYLSSFDYNKFYDWAESQDMPVYISEYWMPEDRFKCVWAINHSSTMCATLVKSSVEKLFIPIKQETSINQLTLF